MEEKESDNAEYFRSEISSLKKSNKRLTFLVVLMGFLYAFFAFKNLPNTGNKIRAKEIIIEDDSGRDRIIISSKISTSKNRLRSDTLSGMLVLDQSGNDRVILGESPTIKSKGKIVRRSVNGPYGLAFNNELGEERGGFGYYSDKGLSALGIDGPNGEGIVLFVPKKELYGQKVGFLINDPQQGGQLFYLGATTTGQRIFSIDVQGKGRFSIESDSASLTKIKHFNYTEEKERVLLNSE